MLCCYRSETLVSPLNLIDLLDCGNFFVFLYLLTVFDLISLFYTPESGV